MSRLWLARVCLMMFLVPIAARADEILNIGDPPPPITLGGWIKGDPVERFEFEKTYVVEFWATWCTPCRTSIPHLSELAQRHREVVFIGVDVLDPDVDKVRAFVAKMGDQMNYRVAFDAIPAGKEPSDGAMNQGWLKAAVEDGIPTAFVVRHAKIAWIGHPLDLDAPLDRIAAGTWNPSTQIPDRLAMKRRGRRANEIRDQVFPIYNDGHYQDVVTALDQATINDPILADEFAWLRFAALCNGADVAAGLELGTRRLETNYDNAYVLNNDAWNVISPRLRHDPDPRVAQLALRAAQRAVELLKAQEPNHLDTLAEAQYRTGDFAGAVASEETALRLFEAEESNHAHPMFQRYHDRIDRFRKAAEGSTAQPK